MPVQYEQSLAAAHQMENNGINKMPISKMIALIFLLLLISCATTQNNSSLNALWLDKTADQLIAERGAPSEVNHLANNHTYYIYNSGRNQRFPYPDTVNRVIAGPNGVNIGYSVPNTNPAIYTLHCQQIFELDDKNKIIATKERGQC